MRAVVALIVVGIAVVLVGAGTDVAQALWSAKGAATTQVAVAGIGASESGFANLGGSVTPDAPSRTTAVSITNTGSVTTGFSTAVTLSHGSGTALSASTITVWSGTTTSACTTSASVPRTATTGSWSSFPAMSKDIASGATAVWCIRSTATATQASAGDTVTGALAVKGTLGSWSASANDTATQTTKKQTVVTGGFTCDNDDWNVSVSWNASTDASYDIEADGTSVATATGYWPYATLTRDNVTTAVASDGTVTITVTALSGSSKGKIIATGTVVAAPRNGLRAIQCS